MKSLKPGTHCATLLAILSDGRSHSTSSIIKRQPMIVHSRVAELRRYGFEIIHETVPGRKGGRGHTYRLVSVPPELSLSPELMREIEVFRSGNGDAAEPLFEYETLSRMPEAPYRVYVVRGEEPLCIAAAPTEQAVGVAICTLAREGEFDNCLFGLMEGTNWLVNPYDQR